MTMRAKHIQGLADALQHIALNGLYYRCFGSDDKNEKEKRAKQLEAYMKEIKAHLCYLAERNSEQAEALMNEFGLEWREDSKYKE